MEGAFVIILPGWAPALNPRRVPRELSRAEFAAAAFGIRLGPGREVVGASGFQPRPLGDRPAGGPDSYRRAIGRTGLSACVGALLRPARGRVLPRLLAS